MSVFFVGEAKRHMNMVVSAFLDPPQSITPLRKPDHPYGEGLAWKTDWGNIVLRRRGEDVVIDVTTSNPRARMEVWRHSLKDNIFALDHHMPGIALQAHRVVASYAEKSIQLMAALVQNALATRQAVKL